MSEKHHYSIALRMKFFNALASPTALCGLAMLPLTKRSLQKLGVVQRKMLRCMGGWKSVEGEKWSGTMRSVQRVALVLFHFVSDEARVENEHLFLDTRNLFAAQFVIPVLASYIQVDYATASPVVANAWKPSHDWGR